MKSSLRDGLTLFATFKRYMALCTLQDKILMIAGLLCGIVNGLFMVVRLYMFGVVVDVFKDVLILEEASNDSFSFGINSTFGMEFQELVSSHENSMRVVVYIYGSMIAINAILGCVEVMSWETVCRRQTRRLRNAFFEHALRLDVSWHDVMKRTEDLNVRLNDDIERVQTTFGSQIPFMTKSMTSVPLSVAYTFYVHWTLGVATLAGITLVSCTTFLTGKVVRANAAKEQKHNREAGNIVNEILTSLKIVKTFGREECEIRKFSEHVKREKRISLRKNMAVAFQYGVSNGVLYLILSGCIYLTTFMFKTGTNNFGQVISSIGCFRLTSSMFSDVLPFMSDVIETLTSCSNVFAFLETPILIDSTSDKGVQIESLTGDICFKDVNYHYPSRSNTKVLDNFNMVIPGGKVVGIVGESGAGKTTLLGLIMRFFDATSGEVSINGVNLKEMSVVSLRKKMAVVSQEPILFDGTIEENIRYGRLGASFDDVERAAILANAHDFIKEFPQGYQTLVGERGSRLSGGQKQRIVIARALIRDPDVLLLDEATSALDNHSERAIQKTLDNASKGRTTVIISHKLNAVKNADFIFVLKNGCVVENGNHNELLAKRGVYYSLINKQNIGKEHYANESQYDNALIRNAKERFNFKRRSSSLESVELKRRSFDDESNLNKRKNNKNSVYQLKELSSPSVCSTVWTVVKMSKTWMVILGILCCSISGLSTPAYFLIFVCQSIKLSALKLDAMIGGLRLVSLEIMFVGIIITVLLFLGINCAARTADDAIASLRVKMLKSALSQKFEFFDETDKSPTNIANAINQKPFQFKNIGGSKAGDLCGVLAFSAAAFAMSLILFWSMALLQLCLIPVVLGCSYQQVKSKIFVQRKKDERSRDSSKFAALCFDNIKTVHCLSLHSFLKRRYESFWEGDDRAEFKALIVLALTYGMTATIPNIMAVLNFSVGYYWFLEGKGSESALATNIPMFTILFYSVGGIILYIQNLSASISSMIYALNLISSTKETNIEDSTEQVEIQGRIQFQNVAFSYGHSKNERRILKGLNLTIESGTVFALVGPSGCGKSTIINLIEKLYLANDGLILVDGKDIRQISDRNMRDSISLVTQEPLLFNASIRENILYGLKTTDSNVSDERIIECCEQAKIHQFISSLPLGYETIVGARGSQLSGGQKQRIAIARALIRKPKILLLDEATSALDSESEKEVQEALNEASKGRTTVTVAHRLSTVKNADVIAVMNNGRIVESGTHDELVIMKGRYYDMLMDQC